MSCKSHPCCYAIYRRGCLLKFFIRHHTYSKLRTFSHLGNLTH
jgi:hypothetical protein